MMKASALEVKPSMHIWEVMLAGGLKVCNHEDGGVSGVWGAIFRGTLAGLEVLDYADGAWRKAWLRVKRLES